MFVRLFLRWVHPVKVKNAVSCGIAAFFLVVLPACLPEMPAPTPAPPTATATVTPTLTNTIVWFPATATFTPMPTREILPTEDLRPGLGGLLFEDSFTDKTQWQTAQTSAGNIAYGKGALTLAVASPKGTLISLRKAPQLENFFLEINVLPSLCRSGDVYGLLLRASSPQDFYRFLLNCDGQARLERVKNGSVLPLYDWTTNRVVFPGGMMTIRLGVWAMGEELRFFVDDQYQFSIKDPVWKAGMLGFFARSTGETPLTVSFSNLVVYGLEASQIPRFTSTPRPKITPVPTLKHTLPPP